MPRWFALFAALIAGTVAGTLVLAASLGAEAIASYLFLVLFVTSTLTALVCVPALFLLIRLGRFSPRGVSICAALCAVPVAVWFNIVEPSAPFVIAALVAGIASALAFNTIFFRRVAL